VELLFRSLYPMIVDSHDLGFDAGDWYACTSWDLEGARYLKGARSAILIGALLCLESI
jgi:hypothetical protein